MGALIEQKSGKPHVRDNKGEAVVYYCKTFIVMEMEYHRLCCRVNKIISYFFSVPCYAKRFKEVKYNETF